MRATGPCSALAVQELIVLEKASLGSGNGFGGCRGQLIAEVRFVKHTIADAGPVQAVETPAEPGSVADATDDERRMFEVGGQVRPGGFESGVTGLDHPLRGRQVSADEDVHVGLLIYLPELHGTPPQTRNRVKLRPAGLEPALTRF